MANQTKKSETEVKTNNSTLVKGLIQFGDIQEDSSEVSFIRGTLLSANPCDEQGNPVSNPGSIMVYSAKGLKTGDCEVALLIKRGLAGLYDFVQPENHDKILKAMNTTLEEIPEIPVVESQASTMDRTEARKRASEKRRKKQELRDLRLERSLIQERELNSFGAEIQPAQPTQPIVMEDELV